MIETITLKDDYTFLVSDLSGEVQPGLQGHGLYYEDTRYLSGLELTINGLAAQVLNSSADYNIAATFHLSSPHLPSADMQDSTVAASQTAVAHAVGIVRRRLVQGGLHEQLEFTNFHSEPVTLEIGIKVTADFADIFEVRGFPGSREGETVQLKVEDDGQRLVFSSVPGKPELPVRTLNFSCDRWPDRCEQSHYKSLLNNSSLPQVVLYMSLNLPTNQPKTLRMQIIPEAASAMAVAAQPAEENFASQVARMRQVYRQWSQDCSQVSSNDYLFNQVLQISTLDLRSLMQRDGKNLIVTAGLPWYFTLFGRDSLVTAIQTLSLNPQIAIDTLRALAAYQGKKTDDWRDEEPGKILHELRRGDMTLGGEMPHGPYYGSVDSTLLFIQCFAETLRWVDDQALFAELWPAVENALNWATTYGDADGDGYIEFSRRSARGILHQGWKDSDESMGGSMGPHPVPPIALIEVQGYYYAALRELAGTLRHFGDTAQQERARQLEEQAARLKTRFNQDFWWPEAGFFAQALDGQKNQVRNITSNPGHCLWSGIVDQAKAAPLVERLMQPDMLSGWGIRTMSTLDPTYNPMSYHNGSIWPHDNSLIVAGMRRYGFDREALALAGQLFDAAATFPHSRLPELYCGFGRVDKGIEERVPAAYPVSCSPQAWAAGTAPLLLQTLLGLEADAADHSLKINPLLPPNLHEITLRGLRLGQTRLDLTLKRQPQTGKFEVIGTLPSPVKLVNPSTQV